MKVCDRLKETNHVSKIRVCVDLFKEGLRKAVFIFFIGPIEDLPTGVPDAFVGDLGLPVTSRFLLKPKFVAPNGWSVGHIGEVNFYRDFWITPRC